MANHFPDYRSESPLQYMMKILFLQLDKQRYLGKQIPIRNETVNHVHVELLTSPPTAQAPISVRVRHCWILGSTVAQGPPSSSSTPSSPSQR